MDVEQQSLVEEEVASVSSLRKQVQTLRRLLKESESALAAKRAKRCLHSKKVLATCGPRDNGMFDYQCMHCGAFL